MLPFLMELWNYCERVGIVIKNLVQQLSSLYTKFNKTITERQSLLFFQNVHFQAVFAHLGDMFGCLITLDEIISQNQMIGNHLILYKR